MAKLRLYPTLMRTISMALTIAEGEAPEEWCLHMHRATRHDLTYYEVYMACCC